MSWQRLGRGEQPPPCDDPDAYDSELVEVFADFFRAFGKYYFRLQIEGVQNVPLTGPALLVGNHNGGVLPFDSMFTALAIHDHSKRFGQPRLLHALAHDSLFSHPVLRSYAQRLGILRAHPDAAQRVLRQGQLALVYPGSDWDACRPFTERHRVILGGRRGFLRLALRNGVPIVPVVSVGTHEQLIILTRGDRLAKALRLHKLMRTDTLPLGLALPWGLSSALFPYWPLPAQTSLAFGAPLHFPDVSPAQCDDDAVLSRCYAVVEARMQTMLDELSSGRIPILGRPAR